MGGVPTKPLWQALREALAETGISGRRLARMLHALEPGRSRESWERSLRRYMDNDNPVTPNRKTADLLARALGKPDDYFVRRPQRVTEIERLRAENAELRRRLEEAERRADG